MVRSAVLGNTGLYVIPSKVDTLDSDLLSQRKKKRENLHQSDLALCGICRKFICDPGSRLRQTPQRARRMSRGVCDLEGRAAIRLL